MAWGHGSAWQGCCCYVPPAFHSADMEMRELDSAGVGTVGMWPTETTRPDVDSALEQCGRL